MLSISEKGILAKIGSEKGLDLEKAKADDAMEEALKLAEAKEKELADKHGAFPALDRTYPYADIIAAMKLVISKLDPRGLTEPEYDQIMAVLAQLQAGKEQSDA